jgi:hypothetical protein
MMRFLGTRQPCTGYVFRTNCARLFVFLFGCLLVPTVAVFGQADITFRVLDAESGKPITGVSLAVFVENENGGGQKPQPNGILRIDKNMQSVKTDKQGRAIFHFYYEPSLKSLLIDSVGELRGCSARRFSIEEVQRSGVVAGYHAGQPKWCVTLRAQATAKPGEVVIFDKRLTASDRMRQEIP